jgi:hypothetical protein
LTERFLEKRIGRIQLKRFFPQAPVSVWIQDDRFSEPTRNRYLIGPEGAQVDLDFPTVFGRQDSPLNIFTWMPWVDEFDQR